jgi:ribosomal protein L11 methyltransferase
MNYIQYIFQVTPPEPGSDILTALLADLGFESFNHNDTGFDAYIQEDQDNEALVKELGFNDFAFSYQRVVIPKTNWNEEWEKNFSPVYVDDLVCIRAHFHNAPLNVKEDIIITPKMSFGTGHHDTTWLICKTMFEIDFNNKQVLDMGCGTGVLAILAKKLGASNILGIDIDDWSIENSNENASINLCDEIIFKKGDASLLPSNETFDIIIANINKNVLKNDMKSYYQCLKPNGTLLLSGFFTADIDELVNLAFSIGYTLNKTFDKNGWAVIKLNK